MRNGGDNQFGNIENGNSQACQAFDYNNYNPKGWYWPHKPKV